MNKWAICLDSKSSTPTRINVSNASRQCWTKRTVMAQTLENIRIMRCFYVVILGPVHPILGNIQADTGIARLRDPEPALFEWLGDTVSELYHTERRDGTFSPRSSSVRSSTLADTTSHLQSTSAMYPLQRGLAAVSASIKGATGTSASYNRLASAMLHA